MLTDSELREIRARAEATSERVGKTVADLEFDFYARADVLRLLDEIERLTTSADWQMMVKAPEIYLDLTARTVRGPGRFAQTVSELPTGKHDVTIRLIDAVVTQSASLSFDRVRFEVSIRAVPTDRNPDDQVPR